YYRQQRGEKRDGAGQPAKGGQVPARSYPELAQQAEAAVQWLRSSKLGAAPAGDVIYGLPWFLIAGPPASGKTSLLLSAGLDFHTVSRQSYADQQLIRPTRNCEWRVTDEAVLLDTAGRYQAEGAERDE